MHGRRLQIDWHEDEQALYKQEQEQQLRGLPNEDRLLDTCVFRSPNYKQD
jgi:hypothetical protein